MWEKDRRIELSDLESMLHTLATINQGSNFIGKLNECIEVAKASTDFNLDTNRRSLVEFLRNEATKD